MKEWPYDLLDAAAQREEVLEEQRDALLAACHAFCRTLAFTPSSIPGAIETDLNHAYNMARAAIAKVEGAR